MKESSARKNRSAPASTPAPSDTPLSHRILDDTALPDVRRRLRTLSADTPARWGGLDCGGMVRHLRATVELSLGEMQAPRVVPTWIGRPVGWLSLYVFTRWPRGRKSSKPAVPVLFPGRSTTFDEDRERLLAALERFVEHAAAKPLAHANHPLMGTTTRRRWARVHALHVAHHLRQFGA